MEGGGKTLHKFFPATKIVKVQNMIITQNLLLQFQTYFRDNCDKTQNYNKEHIKENIYVSIKIFPKFKRMTLCRRCPLHFVEKMGDSVLYSLVVLLHV